MENTNENIFKKLVGCTILEIEDSIEHTDILLLIKNDKGELRFMDYSLFGDIWLEDGLEDLQKMIGETVLSVEVSESGDEEFEDDRYVDDNSLWVYYKIKTFNHDAHLRFYGQGEYSNEASLVFDEI